MTEEKKKHATEETPSPVETPAKIPSEETVVKVVNIPKKNPETRTTSRRVREEKTPEEKLAEWSPKTRLGIQVKNGDVKTIDEVLQSGTRIFETEIVDQLIPEGKTELLFIGQAKGKFGGGKKRVFKQTQKKTPEGNKPSFGSFAVFGNENGYVGGGFGKSKDTVPSRNKAERNSKLNVFRIQRGCGSWECGCKEPHSIPFAVEGKVGSSRIKLIPAPKGKGLVIEGECAKILKAAGIKDVWCRTLGKTKQKRNLISACLKALQRLSTMKRLPSHEKVLGIMEGSL